MINLGLTAIQQAQLLETLAGHHSVNIRVSITDSAGNTISEVSDRLLAGQVDVDTTRDVIRTCLLTLSDPARSLSFDTDSPEDGAIYLDRMIEVIYEVTGELLSDWISVPVFHGPITKVSRDDSQVSIEAGGMEVFGTGSSVAYTPWTYIKGSVRTAVIKSIGTKFMGQTAFDIPDASGRTPIAYSLAPDTQPWPFAKALARAENGNLFMDGRGVMVLRPISTKPVFTFKSGDGGTILSKPKATFSSDNVFNIVHVTGATGAHGPITSVAIAADSHPMSPVRLGRNGVPRRLVEFITAENLRTRTEIDTFTQTRLRQRLLQDVDVRVDVMVNPLLEEFDVVRIETDEFSTDFVLNQFTIPLVVADGNSMNVGYLRNRPVKGRNVNR